MCVTYYSIGGGISIQNRIFDLNYYKLTIFRQTNIISQSCFRFPYLEVLEVVEDPLVGLENVLCVLDPVADGFVEEPDLALDLREVCHAVLDLLGRQLIGGHALHNVLNLSLDRYIMYGVVFVPSS